jgi:hypothetical protein
MSAVVGYELTMPGCLIESGSMLIWNHIVEFTVDNKNGAMIGSYSGKIVKRVSDKEIGNQVF